MDTLKHITPYLHHVIAELDNIKSSFILFLKNDIKLTDEQTAIRIQNSLPKITSIINEFELIASILE